MRIRRILKRCTSAVLITVMLTITVGISVLDAHVVDGGPHFDAPADPACSSPQHNHSLCEFLAATPVLGTVADLPELSRSRELTLRLQETEASHTSGTPLRPRSRSPPLG